MNLKKAAFINALGKYSKIFLTIVVNAILARLLTPNDYGIVAVITVFSTFFTTFSDMGFSTAIIQKKDLKKYDIDHIFSLTVYISFFLAIVFAFLSYPLSLFYNNHAYFSLGLLLSISLFFDALSMVPNGILNRNKKFITIAFRTVIVYAIAAIITVVLAYLHFRYYSLAIQAILTAFFTFIWNYLSIRPKFNLRIDLSSVKKVLNYSGYQFAFNIVNYFSRNLDNLLAGKFFGSTSLGYYNKAYSLMLYPVNNLTGVVTPVLHPLLSDYQNIQSVIYEKYMKVFKILFCVALIIAPICYLASDEIIDIIYGSNWDASAECFRILSIAIIPQMINASAGAVFQATNNTKLLFVNSCINTTITVVAILLGVFWGRNIISLSYFVAGAYWLHFFTVYLMLIRLALNRPLKEFFRQLIPEGIILIGMVIACIMYNWHVSSLLFSLGLKGGYLGIIYLVLLFITGEYRIYIHL
ncbi:lipopolysaccharide biosynthesis protein [Loigolactobacillus coryniformis]|uniref:lipopolysaccharide biosynthesis protein n=1 Tax=Loigolactobacillus coryniformis TaxID=1610 RepID=UPI00201AC142|nr:lipopolysaccharide biosynthesis protein [Loigolactobacillus coryniformis]MCL5457520.1 lipopolysaccharide biosynthesis protein [Loigolactobacillus coryniformis]